MVMMAFKHQSVPSRGDFGISSRYRTIVVLCCEATDWEMGIQLIAASLPIPIPIQQLLAIPCYILYPKTPSPINQIIILAPTLAFSFAFVVRTGLSSVVVHRYSSPSHSRILCSVAISKHHICGYHLVRSPSSTTSLRRYPKARLPSPRNPHPHRRR